MNAHIPLLLAFLAALFLSGCDLFDDDDDDDIDPVPTTDLRIIHASPDAPRVNVRLDGTLVVEGADYTQAALLKAGVGTRSLSVEAQLPGNETLTVIGPEDVSLQQAVNLDVIAVGKVAGESEEALAPLVLSDDGSLSDADKVRVRVVHLASNAPEVDVYVTPPDADLSTSSPLGRFSFKESLPAEEVPAGDYQIRVTRAGDVSSVVFDSGTVSLAAGKDLLIGAVTATGVTDKLINLIVVDGGDAARIFDKDEGVDVRAVHASAGTNPVDVFIDNALAVPELAFTEAAPGAGNDSADYANISAGITNFKIAPAGLGPDGAVIEADLNLANGGEFTLLAVNELPNIEPLLAKDNNRSVATAARLRVIHASVDAGNVDVYAAPGTVSTIGNNEPVLVDIPFKAVSDYLDVPAGDFTVFVTFAGSGSVAIGPIPISLAAGEVYTVVARDGNLAIDAGVITLDDFQ